MQRASHSPVFSIVSRLKNAQYNIIKLDSGFPANICLVLKPFLRVNFYLGS